MASDDSLIESLERAVQDDPDAVSLRAHLVGQLIAAGMGARAVEHAAYLHASRPDDGGYLALLADSYDAAGDAERAASYRRLASLVGHESARAEPAAGTGDVAPPETSLGSADDIDYGSEVDLFVADVLREQAEQQVRLDDVAGLEEVKRRVELSFLGPLRNPELRMAYGKKLRGGLLLWGPPGCGKTYLARAIAGELGATFIAVGIHEVLDMYIGNSERNLFDFFATARRLQPSVLFFDEIDALGFSRTRQQNTTGRNLVALMLNELDGLGHDNDSVFVLAATNQPWDVDAALLRPGRFDRTVLVLPPDRPARRAIVEMYLQNRPTERIDADKVAASTDGFSGADLRLVCESATEMAFEEASRLGRIQPITQRHLDAAMGSVKPSVGAWLDGAKNYARYSNEGGEYDELAEYLRRHRRR